MSVALAMHPLLLSSDFDPFQVAIIVIAVLVGFVKWLWESWQQNQASKPVPLPNPEEQRLREAAWRKQTGQSSSAPPPLPPVVPPSPWEELRKAWKELQETARPTPPRPTQQRTPPPIPPQRQQQPQRQRQPQPARAPTPMTASPAATMAPAGKPVVAASPAAVVISKPAAPAGSVLATLHSLRRDPALMRQAILMQEILGPPKALQSSRDFAI